MLLSENNDEKYTSIQEVWCPNSRGYESTNRYLTTYSTSGIPKDCTCLGSSCAMWVYFDQEKGLGYCGLIKA